MDSKRNLAAAAAASVLSGAALFLATGLHPVWWLMWLAPVPVLAMAPRLRARYAFGMAATAWLLGALNQWTYLRGLIGIPLTVVLTVIILPALIFGATVLLYRAYLRRGQPVLAALALPCGWVATEFLNSLTSPHGTWGSLAYTQMDFLPLVQIASVTGAWGISFVVLLFADAVAALIIPGPGKRKLAAGLAVALAVVLGGGAWRLASGPAAQDAVTVGLAATDFAKPSFPHQPSQAMRLLSDYAGQAKELASRGARLIVFPEKIAVVEDAEIQDVDRLFGAAAAANGVEIMAGVAHRTAMGEFNEARLYSASGNLESVYRKHHLVPGLEAHERPGNALAVLPRSASPWGIEICKDLDFPALARRYGQRGVGLALVPAWDFNVDGWLHDRMAVLRGVENGFSIARAAKNGLLTASDNRGRILAQRATGSEPFATLIATLPTRSDPTLYARLGNWFGWFNVAGLVLFVALLFRTPAGRTRLVR